MSRDAEYYLGQWGEALAARLLYRQGFHILAHRYTCREGELDLVARRGETLAVVEVKLRSGRHDAGAAAVTARKQGRIRTAAARYLTEHPGLGELTVRFDVCQITAPQGTATAEPGMDYFENAFY